MSLSASTAVYLISPVVSSIVTPDLAPSPSSYLETAGFCATLLPSVSKKSGDATVTSCATWATTDL